MDNEKAVIYESGEEAQYDATAKLLLSQKPFLANIVVRTVKEFIMCNLSQGINLYQLFFFVQKFFCQCRPHLL